MSFWSVLKAAVLIPFIFGGALALAFLSYFMVPIMIMGFLFMFAFGIQKVRDDESII